jgi:hypothetical protein
MNRLVQWRWMAGQIEKSVEGVCKHAIGGELHGVFGTQNHIQPGVLTTIEAMCHRRRNQSVSGDWNEFPSFKPQQTRGIARNQPAYDVQQTRISILGDERRRQIPGNFQQSLQLCI